VSSTRIVRQVWHKERATRAVRDGSAEGLQRAGDYALARANENVPVDTGDLRDSGRVDVDEREGVVVVSYDEPYAVKQHEDTFYTHTSGRAKWLQLAVQEAARRFPGIFRDSIEPRLR